MGKKRRAGAKFSTTPATGEPSLWPVLRMADQWWAQFFSNVSKSTSCQLLCSFACEVYFVWVTSLWSWHRLQPRKLEFKKSLFGRGRKVDLQPAPFRLSLERSPFGLTNFATFPWVTSLINSKTQWLSRFGKQSDCS